MQANICTVHILLEDKVAEKGSSVMGLLPIPRQLHIATCQVLQGELVASIPYADISSHGDGQNAHNYRTLHKDSATFYDDGVDVAPLTQYEYGVLAGVASPTARYGVFLEGDMDWGTRLKVGDRVLVELPGLEAAASGAALRASAVIRYVGVVKTLPGVIFGVEIQDKGYLGWGSTDGTFHDERYFTCKDGNGMFVSLDKLSKHPAVGSLSQPPPSSQHSISQPQPVPRNRAKPKAVVGASADPQSTARYKFKKDDRVVVFSKKGIAIHGAVKWVGMYNYEVDKKQVAYKAVGVETDVKVKHTEVDGLPNKGHLFTPSKGRSAVFCTEEETILEADFANRPPERPPRKSQSQAEVEPIDLPPPQSQSPTQSLVTVDQPPTVQVGDRVVLNNKRGVACHGEVKWMGTESAARKFGYPVVGMVMDDELSYMDFEGVVPGMVHLISGSKKNNRLFMPASLVSVDQRKLELSATTAQPQAEVEPIDLPPPIWAPPEEKANPVHSNLPSHPFHHPPPSQPPATSPPASVGLSVGSAVQLVQDPSRTGVTRWTGYLAGAPLLIAGVELDRPMDGCGDGEWRGVRYFTCQQGRAFFCHVNNITAIYTQTEGQKKEVQENLETENRSLRQQIEQLKSDHQAQVNQLHREIGEKDQENAILQQQLAQELERSQSLQEQLARANTEQMHPATQLLKNVKFNMVKRSEVSKQANIGEGAWGVVARGTLGGRAVAVKCPHVALLKQFPKVMDRLRREVAIMAQVRHPNLVRFIAAVFDEAAEQLRQSPMIITELLDTNLRSAYQERRVQRTDYLTILRDIAYALHYLHGLQQPIIHRDVSSPNVLLQKQPSGGWLAKVSDFGSANLAKLAYTAGEGAIIYTAPEAFPDIASDTDTEPPPMTTKIDVYSYGVVVCELIAGEMPVSERYRAMLQQVKGKWPAMHSLIVRCTKRNPLDRPTMADILDELSQHSR